MNRGKNKRRSEQKTNNDRKSNEHKSKSIKVKTEEIEKERPVRLDPEFDNHGLSFEEMLMSGVTKVKKKKLTFIQHGEQKHEIRG